MNAISFLRKTAKNLFKLGLSIEQLAEAAELSIEEVKKLKEQIENWRIYLDSAIGQSLIGEFLNFI